MADFRKVHLKRVYDTACDFLVEQLDQQNLPESGQEILKKELKAVSQNAPLRENPDAADIFRKIGLVQAPTQVDARTTIKEMAIAVDESPAVVDQIFRMISAQQFKAQFIKLLSVEKSCGCIIIQDQKVLVISSKDDNGEIFWGFPKGHQEAGETDIETALRETKEETNLEVEIIDPDPIKHSHMIYSGAVRKDILFFLARPQTTDVKIQVEELVGAEWMSFDEADRHLGKMGYYQDVWHAALKRLKAKSTNEV